MASSSKDHEKGLRLVLDKEADKAQIGQHDDALQVASYKGHEGAALQVTTECDLISDETKHLPMPGAIEDDSSGFESEILSDEDEDFNNDESILSILKAMEDDSSGSGYKILSDEDEDEDSETGDPILPEYDSPLANLRDRISKPVKYFDRLQKLAHLVYQHSTLQTYRKNYSPQLVTNNFEPCPRYPKSLKELPPDDFEPIPDLDVMQICRDVGVTHKASANDLLEILECRNVSAQTYTNLRRLQLDGFCEQKFSILAIDPSRQNVVRLLPIEFQQVLQLLKEIESVLKRSANFARHAPPSTPSAKSLLEQALGEPHNLLLSVPWTLATLGLVLASPSNTRTKLSISVVLRLVVNMIDLAVASYAGAHLSRFDEEYLGEEVSAIDVLGPSASQYQSQIPSIKLSRRRLQCLDLFHHSQSVWVFSSTDWKSLDPLFLSTKVEDFADIWGPLWKAIHPEAPNSCCRYVVGNGSIYKWKSQKGTPRLLENETLCHWLSDTTTEAGSEYSSDTEELVFPDIINTAFDGDETLLIGAVAAGRERLAINIHCNFNLEDARSLLDHGGRVQMLGAVKEYVYKDSQTYQLSAGHGGVTAGVSKQYKRRSQSLKQALVELWTNTPDLRDPRLLEDFYGLEVSLCTYNAQRIQLARILGLGSMSQHLKSFRWKTDSAKQAYFDVLKSFRDDDDALQRTWERHKQHQEDFGQAVLVCLRALEKTGVNHKGQLCTFLDSNLTARPELIALEPKEHSWIKLLKDSEHSCCMAVVGDECLEFKHKLGSGCGSSGRSVLRTALVINRLNLPRGISQKDAYSFEITEGWTSRWSVRAMEIGSNIWLGRHGTLHLPSRHREGTLLMNWRAAPPITTVVRALFGKERPHREYSENTEKKARRTRPIPLFVMSK